MSLPSISQARRQAMLDKLVFVYGPDRAEGIYQGLVDVMARRGPDLPEPVSRWPDQSEVMLISYGDSIRQAGQAPLATLRGFLDRRLGDVISAVHILPFYPWSSDDGFSVEDYYAIDPNLGTWEDVRALGRDYRLMFDGVINHISARSDWFQAYLRGDPRYRDWFIEADPDGDYRSVTRPRTLPLLTPFDTARGRRHLWTTFSADQIDLNYRNPQVLLTIIDLLLFYAAQGARYIRLDAIGYLWKEPGTSCIHLPQTHTLIQLFREVLDLLTPQVLLITETNVPHQDNIRYFGEGHNEAHLVYQFPLPPLVLDAFHEGDAQALSHWAAALEPTTRDTAFFNFLASHDGIGVMPARGILAPERIQRLVDKAVAHGGRVSYKTNPDGSQGPYELNINYLDALSPPRDDDDTRLARFVAAQAILLSLAGVPGVYIHSLLGSRNDVAGLRRSGQNRSINREKLEQAPLERELDDPRSLRHRVFAALSHLIRRRRGEPAFHPNGPQQVLSLNPAVFALWRHAPDQDSRVLVLVNVSDTHPSLDLSPVWMAGPARDRVSGGGLNPADGTLTLAPYQAMWLTPD